MTKQPPPWIQKLNREFAFVIVGGNQRIAHFVGGHFSSFLSVDAFLNLVKCRPVIGAGEGGVGKVWLQDPSRRTYFGVTFEPEEIDCGTALNVWSGFGFEP